MVTSSSYRNPYHDQIKMIGNVGLSILNAAVFGNLNEWRKKGYVSVTPSFKQLVKMVEEGKEFQIDDYGDEGYVIWTNDPKGIIPNSNSYFTKEESEKVKELVPHHYKGSYKDLCVQTIRQFLHDHHRKRQSFFDPLHYERFKGFLSNIVEAIGDNNMVCIYTDNNDYNKLSRRLGDKIKFTADAYVVYDDIEFSLSFLPRKIAKKYLGVKKNEYGIFVHNNQKKLYCDTAVSLDIEIDKSDKITTIALFLASGIFNELGIWDLYDLGTHWLTLPSKYDSTNSYGKTLLEVMKKPNFEKNNKDLIDLLHLSQKNVGYDTSEYFLQKLEDGVFVSQEEEATLFMRSVFHCLTYNFEKCKRLIGEQDASLKSLHPFAFEQSLKSQKIERKPCQFSFIHDKLALDIFFGLTPEAFSMVRLYGVAKYYHEYLKQNFDNFASVKSRYKVSIILALENALGINLPINAIKNIKIDNKEIEEIFEDETLFNTAVENTSEFFEKDIENILSTNTFDQVYQRQYDNHYVINKGEVLFPDSVITCFFSERWYEKICPEYRKIDEEKRDKTEIDEQLEFSTPIWKLVNTLTTDEWDKYVRFFIENLPRNMFSSTSKFKVGSTKYLLSLPQFEAEDLKLKKNVPLTKKIFDRFLTNECVTGEKNKYAWRVYENYNKNDENISLEVLAVVYSEKDERFETAIRTSHTIETIPFHVIHEHIETETGAEVRNLEFYKESDHEDTYIYTFQSEDSLQNEVTHIRPLVTLDEGQNKTIDAYYRFIETFNDVFSNIDELNIFLRSWLFDPRDHFHHKYSEVSKLDEMKEFLTEKQFLTQSIVRYDRKNDYCEFLIRTPNILKITDSIVDYVTELVFESSHERCKDYIVSQIEELEKDRIGNFEFQGYKTVQNIGNFYFTFDVENQDRYINSMKEKPQLEIDGGDYEEIEGEPIQELWDYDPYANPIKPPRDGLEDVDRTPEQQKSHDYYMENREEILMKQRFRYKKKMKERARLKLTSIKKRKIVAELEEERSEEMSEIRSLPTEEEIENLAHYLHEKEEVKKIDRRNREISESDRETRSEEVKEIVRSRMTDEKCEGCRKSASEIGMFVDKNDRIAWEFHHISFLSRNGVDEPYNTAGLCQICHARVHRGKDGEEFNEEIRKYVLKKEMERLELGKIGELVEYYSI